MSTIFSKIISGDIPSFKIAETKNCYAFLDINPLAKGHTLVIPKKETDYYFDLEDDLFIELNLFAKKIASAIDLSIPCERVGVAIIGLEVPHTHIHLIPLNNVEDINFSKPKLSFTNDEMKSIAEAITSNVTL